MTENDNSEYYDDINSWAERKAEEAWFLDRPLKCRKCITLGYDICSEKSGDCEK